MHLDLHSQAEMLIINLNHYFLILIVPALIDVVGSFSIADYTHYLDYLPYRNEGLATLADDFRTSIVPPSHLRNRKMKVGGIQLQVEDILSNPVWPSKWPYSSEDFRPLDYTKDSAVNTIAAYQSSQSLIATNHVTLIPGFVRLPIKRHFVFPKVKKK